VNTSWGWDPRSLGPTIGVVTSGARASLVPVRISRDMIEVVRDEMLVVIDDYFEGRRYLGCVRSSTKLDIAIDGYALPTTFDPERSSQYAAPMMNALVEILGEIGRNGGLETSFAIPRPGSVVYLVNRGDLLARILGMPRGLVVGRHKFSGLELHLDPRALNFHVAVIGATGTGKSRLVKALVEEVLEKTNYSVVIFDHTGVDYADPSRWRIVPEIVSGTEIVLHPVHVAQLLIEKTGVSSYFEEHIYYSVLRYIIDATRNGAGNGEGVNGFTSRASQIEPDRLASVDVEKIIEEYYDRSRNGEFSWSYEAFLKGLENYLEELHCRPTTILKMKMLMSVYVGRAFFDQYLARRRIVVRDLVRDVVEGRKRFVVVDLSSDVEAVSKRSIVATFLHELWNYVIELRRPVNVLVVVDEAHNYACQRCSPCIEEIERTAREGRKWGLGLVLASQRIRDLSTDVRGNINTVFFSRLQVSSDFQELRGWVEGVQSVENVLPLLTTREFFVAGLANPFRKPMLLKVREVA